MPFTLGQAANQVGKSKPTILKALKTGRLSGAKVGNEWQIEPVELFRVYPQTTTGNTNSSHSVNPEVNRKDSIEIAVLQAKLDAAERMVEELREDRDQWRQTANRLLASPPATEPVKGGFLSKLFGKGE
jgi:excisionase family DNA binding protein